MSCPRHRHVDVDRYVAPAQQHLAFGKDGTLDFLFAGDARGVLLGQEDHADAVFAGRRQIDALFMHLFTVILVGNLDQHARAVAHQLVGADGAPMVEIFQDQQALFHDRVAFLAFDVGDEADATGVMFVARVVHSLGVHGHSPQLFSD